MNKKKRVLVIVHGVWPIRTKNKLFNDFASAITTLFTADPRPGIIKKDYHKLADYFRSDYDSVLVFPWNGIFFDIFELVDASKRLSKLLLAHKEESVDIIAVSLGGWIVQEALLHNPGIAINKLLYVGAVHNGKHVVKNASKVFNVYSKVDRMFFVANQLYEGLGNAFLNGENVMNLAIPEVKHGELCKNIIIKKGMMKNINLYDFYKTLLENSKLPFSDELLLEFKKI